MQPVGLAIPNRQNSAKGGRSSKASNLEIQRDICDMRPLFLAIIAIITIGMSLAWAGTIESVRDLPDIVKNPRAGRLSLSDITILDIRIGRETLDNISSRLGVAKVFREPDNSVSANDEICYSPIKSTDTTRLIFGSGPMGGWSHVTQFQVLSKAPQKRSCTVSSHVSRTIETQSNIHLDMTRKELDAILGPPTEQGKGFVSYTFEQESHDTKQGDLAVLSGVSATIVNDHVTSFQVFMIETLD